jgi:60 kDa SS-A/Ro ribonucleoprotein
MPYLLNQTEPLTHSEERVVDNWTRFERFLILGSEDGTYYVQERTLAIENAAAVLECLKTDGLRVVRTAVEISTGQCAPKSDPALFVMALAASPNFAGSKTVSAAFNALPEIARTGKHLCIFAAFVENLRGWGRGLRTAVADWYLSKPASELAFQMLSYERRNGWSHRDLLRLSHPKAATPAHNALFQWAVEGELGHLATPEILSGDLRQIRAFELAKKSASEEEMVQLVEENRLTHEMIPSEWKSSARIWEALLPSMPYLELLRHLGKLTAVGLVQPQSPATALVVARLIDRKRIANSRVHPVALLDVLLAYKQEPAPVASVIEALDEAFYLAFENVAPTGKRVYLAIQSGGSMRRFAMASAALAIIFRRREPNCMIWGVDITPKHRLEQVCEAIASGDGFPDASLAIRDAQNRGLAVDAFVIVAGNRPSTEVLEEYRRWSGIPAKMVVIAMGSNGMSIADPDDAFQMGVAGFDASVPDVLSEFLRGPALPVQRIT